MLTIRARDAERKSDTVYWLCDCECGKRNHSVSRQSLRHARSCGCKRSRMMRDANIRKRGTSKAQKTPEERGFRSVMSTYRSSAKARGLQFELTVEEFRSLIVSPCHYCGIGPSKRLTALRKIPSGREYQVDLTYNGIDRKNNDSGYIYQNCLPCCNACNFAKRDMTYDDFIHWIGRISAFHITQ